MKLRVATPRAPVTRRPLPVLSAQVFTPEECASILAIGQRRTARVAPTGYDPSSLRDLADRTATARWIHLEDDSRWIYERLDQVITAANEAYELPLTEMEVLQLSEYGPGDHFQVHSDFGYLHATRHLSLSVQLTAPDAYQGGDLQFLGAQYSHHEQGAAAAWDQVTGVASRALGSATLFSATLPHRVAPITQGTRWSLVVWVRGTPFE